MKVTGQKVGTQIKPADKYSKEIKHDPKQDAKQDVSSSKKTTSTKASSRYAQSTNSKEIANKTNLSSTADHTIPLEQESDYS